MRRVAIVTNYEYPSVLATSNRISSFKTYLKTKYPNIEITVVGPKKKPKADIYKKNSRSSNNLFLRFFKELGIIVGIVKKLRAIDADIIISTIPSPLLLVIPIFFWKKVNFLDFRDITWDYLFKQSCTRKALGFLMLCLAKISFFFIKGISVTNLYQKKLLLNAVHCGIIVIPNGVSRHRFRLLIENEVFGSSKSRSVKNIVYAGNIGLGQDMDIVLDASVLLPESRFFIIGQGSVFNSIEKRIRTERLENVVLMKSLDWKALMTYLNQADVFVVPIKAEFGSAIPSKIFEYLVVGKPVVFSGPEGAASELLSEFEGTICMSDFSAETLCDCIRRAVAEEHLDRQSVLGNRFKIESEYIREDQLRQYFEFRCG